MGCPGGRIGRTVSVARLCGLYAALTVLSSAAVAHPGDDGVVLNQLEPGTAVDAFFSVPSPWAPGHWLPSGMLGFEYLHRPLVLRDAADVEIGDIVGAQAYLRASAALAILDRLLVHAELPFIAHQSGENPTTDGLTLLSPGSAQLGSLRVGARGVLFGARQDLFQLALGTNVRIPTAPPRSYVGDGGVLVRPHLVVGGRTPFLTYALQAGAALTSTSDPHALVFGGGVAWTGLDGMLQLGPEVFGGVDLSDEPLLDNADGERIGRRNRVSLEGLLGARLWAFGGFVAGAAAGPGLTNRTGSPKLRVLVTVGFAPSESAPSDTDGDGVEDPNDACPRVAAGDRDHDHDGCPPDADGDGILDEQDACPRAAGQAADNPREHGCPDTDGDGVLDRDDACPAASGVTTDSPETNGCPADIDGDGVPDGRDACVDRPGAPSDDPTRSGCPPTTPDPTAAADGDGDGVLDAEDRCPADKGQPNEAEPAKHGCPGVRLTRDAILVDQQIPFHYSDFDFDEPEARPILEQVAKVLLDHPEILKVDIQGHTDDEGGPSFNLTLSRERAEGVRLWLVRAGVFKSRLTASGYGLTVPIASNRTPEGRARNRRVDFRILRWTEGSGPPITPAGPSAPARSEPSPPTPLPNPPTPSAP